MGWPLKHHGLAGIAAGVGGAAVAGYGLSIGHDAWRFTRRNSGFIIFLLVVIAAAALPFAGMRGLVRGHDRGPVGTLLKTVLGNLFLIAAGAGLCGGVLILTGLAVGPDASVAAVAVAAAMPIAGGAAGLCRGLLERRSRLRAFSVTRANEQFMERTGMRETGGSDITHYDADGTALRFLEAHSDRLVFMAVGQRARRAYIDLGPSGEMLSYSGVVSR